MHLLSTCIRFTGPIDRISLCAEIVSPAKQLHTDIAVVVNEMLFYVRYRLAILCCNNNRGTRSNAKAIEMSSIY